MEKTEPQSDGTIIKKKSSRSSSNVAFSDDETQDQSESWVEWLQDHAKHIIGVTLGLAVVGMAVVVVAFSGSNKQEHRKTEPAHIDKNDKDK